MRQIRSEALLLRSVAYGESDVIAQLVTESDGKISAMVRGGRKSTRRVGGALEPFQTIAVWLDDKGGELATMREARIVRMREGISRDLDALDAAGQALRWARHLCPPRTPEPAAYKTLIELLDELDRRDRATPPKVLLAAAAMRLLSDVGWALDLGRCVSCGKERPEGRPAFVDAEKGGVVCSACGGARRRVAPELLALAQAAQRGDRPEMTSAQAGEIIGLVEDTMAAHTGFER